MRILSAGYVYLHQFNSTHVNKVDQLPFTEMKNKWKQNIIRKGNNILRHKARVGASEYSPVLFFMWQE